MGESSPSLALRVSIDGAQPNSPENE